MANVNIISARAFHFIPLLKIIVFVAALVPAVNIVYRIVFDPIALGANPAETILHMTGDWVIYFLLMTLAVTPIRRLTRWNDAIKFRRMLGLYAFFYGVLHFFSYLAFDRLFDLSDMAHEIAKRPFILVGFAAFVLMIPLAVTSTRNAVLWLGGRNWQRLHWAIYPIAILGVVHYWWLVKRDITWPLGLALVLAGLLAYRVVVRGRRSGKRSQVRGAV